MTPSFSTRYQAAIAAGKIEADSGQALGAEHFVWLERRVAEHRLARKSSALGWMFGKHDKAAGPLKGLYVYGEVGRGKTMLMDLFFASSEVQRKRRAHFHEFMADVHERIRTFRQKIKDGEVADDPIRLTAEQIAGETWLLCFDEFHVTDIADAMILGRLFTRLFELGVVLVATSNLAPAELYAGGLNRALFLPFLHLLQQHVDVVRLEARTDFRLEKLAGVSTWYVPADEDAQVALDMAWQKLTGLRGGEPCDIALQGRVLRVPQAAMGVARFTFAQLCEQPLGANDYLRLAHEFHTLLVDNIPVMDDDHRNAAKRFIILIDTLYDNAVKLIASAAAEPAGLYLATEGFEAHEFKRTASRLIEMRSGAYLGLAHGARSSVDSGDAGGIVET